MTENTQAGTPLEFNVVAFGLPGQTFEIDSHVTAEERLPVVTEFAVRLIHLCGGITRANFQAYFGLTDVEAASLIDGLISQHLVQTDDDLITTTAYAEEKFAASSDDLPRFSKVEPRKDVVSFELLTFSLVDRRAAEVASANMVELPITNEENLTRSNEKAEAAFQSNFSEIAGANREQSRELYKIGAVRGKKGFFVPVPVTFSLDDVAQVHRHIPEDDKRRAELLLAMNGAISDLMSSPLSVQIMHLKEFAEVFEDRLIGQFIKGGSFQFDDYINSVFRTRSITYSAGTIPWLGNLYLTGNAQVALEWLRIGLQMRHADRDSRLSTSAAWLGPDYKFWGKTPLLARFVRAVESELGKSGFDDHLHLLLHGQFPSKRTIQDSLRGTGLIRAHMIHGRPMGGRLDLFLIPTRFVCASFHFSTANNPGVWVPFGFISNNVKKIEAARQMIEANASKTNYLGRLMLPGQELAPGEDNDFDTQLPFLQYMPI